MAVLAAQRRLRLDVELDQGDGESSGGLHFVVGDVAGELRRALLQRLEQGGKGRVEIWATGAPEHIQLNQTDPAKEVDGERSSPKTRHPLRKDDVVYDLGEIRGFRTRFHLYTVPGQVIYDASRAVILERAEARANAAFVEARSITCSSSAGLSAPAPASSRRPSCRGCSRASSSAPTASPRRTPGPIRRR